MTALVGAGRVVLDPAEKTADPSAFLRVRKTRKFMGTQDDIAVVAVGRALALAKLAIFPRDGATLIDADRVGLFAAIGFIPFEGSDIDPVLAASLTDDGAFDVRKFNADGYTRAHPLVTFRCLPNMPAYHVSANFGIEGPYFVTYPGAGQAYLALDEARRALDARAVDTAIVFATCHQRNFLVEHHHARLDHPVAPESLRDAACAFVLQREETATARKATVLARLVDVTVGYTPRNPLEDARANANPNAHTDANAHVDAGAAAPFLAIVNRLENLPFSHSVTARDGVTGASTWSAP